MKVKNMSIRPFKFIEKITREEITLHPTGIFDPILIEVESSYDPNHVVLYKYWKVETYQDSNGNLLVLKRNMYNSDEFIIKPAKSYEQIYRKDICETLSIKHKVIGE